MTNVISSQKLIGEIVFLQRNIEYSPSRFFRIPFWRKRRDCPLQNFCKLIGIFMWNISCLPSTRYPFSVCVFLSKKFKYNLIIKDSNLCPSPLVDYFRRHKCKVRQVTHVQTSERCRQTTDKVRTTRDPKWLPGRRRTPQNGRDLIVS